MTTIGADSTSQPSAVDEAADDARDAATRENGDPAGPVHQPPGGERRERRRR